MYAQTRQSNETQQQTTTHPGADLADYGSNSWMADLLSDSTGAGMSATPDGGLLDGLLGGGVDDERHSRQVVTATRLELEILLMPETLTPEQIAHARTLIASLPQEFQGEYYERLQAKAEYQNQRDNESQEGASGGTCNFTAIAMCLEVLGIPNPDPSRDYDEALVAMAGDRDITKKKTWEYVLSDERIGVSIDARWGQQMTRAQWEAFGNAHLAKGHGVVLGVPNHVVRLQGMTDDGLVIDDPYGKSALGMLEDEETGEEKLAFYHVHGNHRGENEPDDDEVAGPGDATRGNDNVLRWSHVEKFTFPYVMALFRG